MTETNIEQQASYWFVVMHADNCSQQDAKRHQAWLDANLIHQKAYRELEALWLESGNFADKAEIQSLRQEALQAAPKLEQTPVSRSKRWLPFSFAAALIVSFSALYLLYIEPAYMPQVAQEQRVYQTQTGEQKTITLKDGSILVLDTQTSIVSEFTKQQRRILLRTGQVRFEVAADASRPFTVAAGSGRITALGTIFVVRRNEDEILVSLLEGEVEIEQEQATAEKLISELEPQQQGKQTLRLKAGQQAAYSETGIAEAAPVNLEQVTAWQQGRLIFDDASLEEVVNDLNRYSQSKILFGDDSLKGIRVSGVFKSGDNERAVKVFKDYFSMRSARDMQGNMVLLAAVSTPPDNSF